MVTSSCSAANSLLIDESPLFYIETGPLHSYRSAIKSPARLLDVYIQVVALLFGVAHAERQHARRVAIDPDIREPLLETSTP